MIKFNWFPVPPYLNKRLSWSLVSSFLYQHASSHCEMCRCKSWLYMNGDSSAHREHSKHQQRDGLCPRPSWMACQSCSCCHHSLGREKDNFSTERMVRQSEQAAWSPSLEVFIIWVNVALSGGAFSDVGAATASLDLQYPRTSAVCHFSRS